MNILDRFRRRKRTNERTSEIRNFCNFCLFRYSLLSKKKTTNTKIIGRGSRLILDPSDGCLLKVFTSLKMTNIVVFFLNIKSNLQLMSDLLDFARFLEDFGDSRGFWFFDTPLLVKLVLIM